jgi:superfamily II DNA or RNA helicase
MNKREQVQQEALDIALQHKKCGLGISMGVGKTLIGLKYLKHFWDNKSMINALVVAPKLSIFQSWKDDAVKFGIDPDMIDCIKFTTYLSLHKEEHDYDIVVLDECHSLLSSHLSFLGTFPGRILGLTGTPPRYQDSEKGKMVKEFCPIRYKYITDDAVEDAILNDYRIVVHRMPLSTEKNICVKTKDKEFYASEVQNYDYWYRRVLEAQTKQQQHIASIMRMKALMSYTTKEKYAKSLFNNIEEKCIIFCNTQDQADKMCEHSYHSNNPDSENNLERFKKGEIYKLSCVMQLNEGVNIPNLREGIIMHSYGNERKANQRIGRLLRLNPTETSTVHILCYKDTVDEKWVTEALKDLDKSKIVYHDVKI